jgi:hypothetical protein
MYGLSKSQTKQTSFAVRRLWMNLCRIDLNVYSHTLLQRPDRGDDIARRKVRAKQLVKELNREGIPFPREKKSTAPAASNALIAADQAAAAAAATTNSTTSPRTGATASSSTSPSSPSSIDEPVPLVDLPAELLNSETTPLHDYSDLSMIRLATIQTAHAAIKESKAGRLTATELAKLYDEIQVIEKEMLALPFHVESSSTSHIQPKLLMDQVTEEDFSLDSPTLTRATSLVTSKGNESITANTSSSTTMNDYSSLSFSPFLFAGFDSFPLLLEPSTRDKLDKLAGAADPSYTKKSTDFLPIHRGIKTLDDILSILSNTVQLCEKIDAPHADSLNGYYQIQSLIQGVLSTAIPLPGGSLPSASAWFSRPLKRKEQVELMRYLWRLGRFYLSAEFSIESPAFVSNFERCVCMWTLETLCDWTLRRAPGDAADPEVESNTPEGAITAVLNGIEGLCPAYAMDLRNGNGLPVRDMLAAYESASPSMAFLYGELVEYWNELESSIKLTGQEIKYLLPFSNSPQHQTCSLSEDSSSLQFIRDVARQAGYVIERRGYAGKETSEVEAVARWLFAVEEGDYSIGTASFGALIPQLVRDHPEFAYWRDLHFLFKLSLVHTHPTCRVVLPGRYSERDASIYWTTQGLPMSNAMVMIYAKTFSKKEIIIIKTRAIESFASCSAYLPANAKGSAENASSGGGFGGLAGLMGGFGGFGSMLSSGFGAAPSNPNAEWTEEDVIHNSAPPLFDSLLSVETSERLMSILTAPYLRIPLVLSFFANKDRVDLLADRRLQRLLAAVVFETGPWASRQHETDIELVPLQPTATTATTSSEVQKARLGSPYGLLLNELSHAAGATLNPFLHLLMHALALDTGHFSSQSATCRLVLFVGRLAARMESYVRTSVALIDSGALHSASQVNTTFLRQAHADLLAIMQGPLLAVLLSYRQQSLSIISEAVWVMSCIALVGSSGLSVPDYIQSIRPSPSLSTLLSTSSRRFNPAATGIHLPPSSLVELLGSFSFVLTWHSMGIGIGKDLVEDEKEGEKNKPTFGSGGGDLMAQFGEMIQASMSSNKLKKKGNDDPAQKEKAAKPPVPEVELFQKLHSIRPTILEWSNAAQGSNGAQLQNVLDDMVTWVHGHKLGEAEAAEAAAAANGINAEEKSIQTFNPQLVAKKPQLAHPGTSNWVPLSSTAVSPSDPRSSAPVGRYVSEISRLEIDLQTCMITFYEHDVFPVHDLIARSADFISVFGREPQHYALIRSQTHRQEYGIFGSSYTLSWWDRNMANECVDQPIPAIASSEMNIQLPASEQSALPEGKWKCGGKGCARINSFSSLRCELCKAYQPMLSAMEKRGLCYHGLNFTRRYGSTILTPDENWIVELLEPLLRALFGEELDTLNYSLWMRSIPWNASDDKVCLFALDAFTFKQIILHRSTSLVECFNLIEHGRMLYRSLIYSSNGRLSLAGLAGESAPVRMAPWESIDRFAVGQWEEVQKKNMSFTLKRKRHINANISSIESFISPELLIGLLPKVLLEHYHFYIVEGIEHHPLVGGENKNSNNSSSQLDVSWFGVGDILGFLQKPYHSHVQWNFDLHIRLIARNGSESAATAIAGADGEFKADLFAWDKFRALVSQVTRGAAGSTNTAALTLTTTTTNAPSTSPSASPSPSPSLSPSPDASPSLSPSLAAPSTGEAAKPFKWMLLNLQCAAPGTILARLCAVLIRLEDLSHILVWAKTTGQAELLRDRRRSTNNNISNLYPILDDQSASSSSIEALSITRVDLPRLKLSFRPRRIRHADGSASWRLFSNDHAGFFISDMEYDNALSNLLQGIPNSLLLENEKKELWLLVPNTPLKRPQVFTCPFSNELLADRSSELWLNTMTNRFYIYPVHLSHTFLLSNTLASTFYLLLLALLSRNYAACARYCETCEIDTPLSAEERFVFSLFEQTLHDQHPDAHAIRLKLYVCVWLCEGESVVQWKSVQGESWSVEEEYSNYCKKIAHISAVCRLGNEEEEVIYQQISYDEKQKKEDPPKVQQNRATVRAAISKALMERANGAGGSSNGPGNGSGVVTASCSSTSAPIIASLTFYPSKRDGLKSVWWEWCKQISDSYFNTEWNPGMWGGMVCYERPSALQRRDIDLIETMGDALNDSMTGSTHKLGFLFLLDMVLGGTSVVVDSADPNGCLDCGFSLGRLLIQFHFLKATSMGEKVQPKPDYLPFAVLGVFGSGFIPVPRLPNWMKREVHSIPSFPPLPQVPYAGVEKAMSSGFLLHKQGTPIYQLFHMLAQWSSGFVKMASEWRVRYGNRPIITADPVKFSEKAVLEAWPSGQPTNTACKERIMHPYSKLADTCSLDAAALSGLVGRTLQSIDVESFLVSAPNISIGTVSPPSSSSSSNLPFDVSSHPSAQSFIAKSMLSRMSDDTLEYATQESQRKIFQVKGISSEDLSRVARECDASVVGESVNRLNLLHAQLRHLREEDWLHVQRLSESIDRMANVVPGITAEHTGALSLPALQFALSRYNGQSFTVKLDYLTALLLSSQPEKDLWELNPHLPATSLPHLLLLLPTLLLLTNRIGLLDRLLFEIDDMRAALRTLDRKAHSVRAIRPLALARSLSGGTQLISLSGEDNQQQDASIQAMAELDELAQQIAIQSTTLADNLLSARHYMNEQQSSNSDTLISYSYDPRFLVFEYIFNIMLRRMQVDLILSFARAAWQKKSIVQQMMSDALT